MIEALRSRLARMSRRRAGVIAGAVLVTVALLALVLWQTSTTTGELGPVAVAEATPVADTAETGSPPPTARATTSSPTAAAEPESPGLVSVSPSGLMPRLATLTIAFQEPPTEVDGARLVSIEPPIEGAYAWIDEQTLLFQPAWPGWVRGRDYEVVVKAAEAGLPDDHMHAFTVEGQLEVSYVIPAAGDRDVPANAQILVQFNRSVAALTVLQEGPGPDVLEIDPPLEGRGEWLNTSLYRFIPTAIEPSTEYRLRVSAGLTLATDGVLLEDHEWSFRSIGPAVTSISPGTNSRFVELDTAVVIRFNQPMDRASVEGGITLREPLREVSLTDALLDPFDLFELDPTVATVVPVRYEWDEASSVVSLPAGPRARPEHQVRGRRTRRPAGGQGLGHSPGPGDAVPDGRLPQTPEHPAPERGDHRPPLLLLRPSPDRARVQQPDGRRVLRGPRLNQRNRRGGRLGLLLREEGGVHRCPVGVLDELHRDDRRGRARPWRARAACVRVLLHHGRALPRPGRGSCSRYRASS